MPIDTKLNQLIINQLTQEQYDEAKAAGTLSDTELYITDSDDDALTNNKISNCITEIPQDIKLELNNGTLTLKAGSKVYVPNGAEVFDTVTVASNKKITVSANGKKFIFLNSGENLQSWDLSNCFSGGTAPTSTQYPMWYDTTNNIIKSSHNYGSTWSGKFSFPICIVTVSNGVLSSIDQVFNGFGYIGSTVFALPGVKGLIPNDRNADGGLKSIEFENEKVLIYNFTTWRPIDICGIALKSNQIAVHEFTYNSETNKLDIDGFAWVGNIKLKNDGTSNINWIRPKTVFHALDYNDKSTISGWSMPSNRYIDLTLGASGSTYAAPANGYFQIWKIAGINKAFFNFVNKTNNMAVNSNTTDTVYSSRMILPVRKGDVIECTYNSTGSTNIFRFIYAEGE